MLFSCKILSILFGKFLLASWRCHRIVFYPNRSLNTPGHDGETKEGVSGGYFLLRLVLYTRKHSLNHLSLKHMHETYLSTSTTPYNCSSLLYFITISFLFTPGSKATRNKKFKECKCLIRLRKL